MLSRTFFAKGNGRVGARQRVCAPVDQAAIGPTRAKPADARYPDGARLNRRVENPLYSRANNGLTLEELEEVIYHTTSHAGFPLANSARLAVVDSLVKEGRITSEGYTDARRRTSDGRGDLLTNRQAIIFDTPMSEAVERPTHPLATASSPAVACHCAAAASDHALLRLQHGRCAPRPPPQFGDERQ